MRRSRSADPCGAPSQRGPFSGRPSSCSCFLLIFVFMYSAIEHYCAPCSDRTAFSVRQSRPENSGTASQTQTHGPEATSTGQVRHNLPHGYEDAVLGTRATERPLVPTGPFRVLMHDLSTFRGNLEFMSEQGRVTDYAVSVMPGSQICRVWYN